MLKKRILTLVRRVMYSSSASRRNFSHLSSNKRAPFPLLFISTVDIPLPAVVEPCVGKFIILAPVPSTD